MNEGILFQNITKSFGIPPTPVLRSVSEAIHPQDFISITGRSGSGKSTLLYILSTLDHATSGDLYIDGENIHSLTRDQIHEFRNLKMGFVFQFHHLLPELTALENVLMPAFKSKQQEAQKPYALELLKEFEIGDKADRFPSQLSGGEQQRVAIARALVMKPRYLFADEPTGNLDSANGTAVLNLFRRINKEMGTTVVFVTHDPEFAKMAKRTIHMVDGKLSS